MKTRHLAAGAAFIGLASAVTVSLAASYPQSSVKVGIQTESHVRIKRAEFHELCVGRDIAKTHKNYGGESAVSHTFPAHEVEKKDRCRGNPDYRPKQGACYDGKGNIQYTIAEKSGNGCAYGVSIKAINRGKVCNNYKEPAWYMTSQDLNGGNYFKVITKGGNRCGDIEVVKGR